MTRPEPPEELIVERMATLVGLLTCASRTQLKEAWLQLTEEQRRDLRPSRALAQHAWALIIRDRILTNAGGTR